MSTSDVKAKVNELALHTVCKEAACPNLAECWGAGTATIMILGDVCTRGCRFCNVKTGNPRGKIDWLEPLRVADAVRDLGWKYLVLTAVDRDDLSDGGALIFANTVRAIQERVARSAGRDSERRLSRRLTGRRYRRRCEARRLRSQSRDGPASHAVGARQACGIRSIAEGPRARKASGAAPLHQNVADARLRRDAMRRSKPPWTTRARQESTSLRWDSTCNRARSICRLPSSSAPKQFDRLGELAARRGFHQVVSSPLSRSSYHAEQAF